MKKYINRASLILCLVSIGLMICCAAPEALGYVIPIKDWLSGFAAYGLIFYIVYRCTCSPNARGPMQTNADSTDATTGGE
jgi:hypothetical protein